MTPIVATATVTSANTTTPSALRFIYLVRAAFSVAWVGLLVATSTSLVSGDGPTAIAAVLLVGYPLWDVVASLLERRQIATADTHWVGTANITLGLVATVAMGVAVFDTIGSCLLVFGIWALLAGALQLTVAIRRRASVGAQWPMMISGGLSVLAGASFAVMSASSTSGLSSIAGYSAFGAFWFLVSAIALTFRGRRAAL
jgi:uncharacterized membrane protein HdeD (DUF308 family)